MLSSNVPCGQRNWNKLCGWNVRANKKGYTRGMSTMTPFRACLNLLGYRSMHEWSLRRPRTMTSWQWVFEGPDRASTTWRGPGRTFDRETTTYWGLRRTLDREHTRFGGPGRTFDRGSTACCRPGRTLERENTRFWRHGRYLEFQFFQTGAHAARTNS